MHSRRLIIRHGLVSLSFVLLYFLLNEPAIVLFSRTGFVAWYPAVGLAMAFLLGVNPWYAFLVCFSVFLANTLIYAQSVLSFSNTVDAAGIAVCYGVAAYVLRGPLQIDLGLRRRRDVVRYVFVSGSWVTPSDWWALHRFFSSMYSPMFGIGFRRSPPISTTPPRHILLKQYSLLVQP
jgi:hypothetical protein